MVEQHDPTPDASPSPAYCTTTPRPGDHLTDACQDCGHAVVLHIGTEHCPVCEMEDHNARARTATTINNVATVAGDASSLADRAWAEIQRRHLAGLPRAPYNPEAADA